MAKSATHEILCNRMWDFLPNALHGYKQTFEENIAKHLPFVKDEQREDRPFILSSKTGFTERTYIQNAAYINFDRLEPEDKVINVIRIEGAILRNGGACSYGSKEHRDIIKRAADDSHTIGHIILMDSGGGTSYAKYDYQDAIDYARSKGQPVIGLVDGMACSAGYAPIAMCNESYAVGLHDMIGCIGTMAALYTQKDGDVNTISQERYVEVYADDSPYKNKEFRDAAEGDYAELQKDVNQLCMDFQGMVKKYRPNATSEQLKGDTYLASEVMGTLIDGQGTMESCIARVIELSGTQTQPIPVATPANPNSESNKPAGAGDKGSSATSESNNQHSINKGNMKEYPKIMSALGLNALVSDKENGLYFNEEMADALTLFIEKSEQDGKTLSAKMTETAQLNATIEKMKKDHSEAIETLNSNHATELTNLKAEHKTTVDGLNESLKNANELIASKDAEIKELSETTQDPPKPQDGAPKGNSNGGQQAPEFKVESIAGSGKTTAEKQKAWKERMEELERRRFS